MDSVNIKRTELLQTLTTNRNAHRKIFLEAQAGYRKMAIRELDAFLSQAKTGARIQRSLTLVEPVDQTKEYDRAIRMLEMSVDETISLSEQDFQCYVMDEWRWKGQFTSSNIGYSKTLRDSLSVTK